MTPFEIEILLHYHYTDDNYAADLCRHKNAPIYIETMNYLTKLGFFNNISHNVYRANSEAISVYVEALKRVPAPILKWTMPNAN